MKIRTTGKFKVKKYNLDSPEEKEEYEEILNDPKKYYITKENFIYDKFGRPLITIWYTEK